MNTITDEQKLQFQNGQQLINKQQPSCYTNSNASQKQINSYLPNDFSSKNTFQYSSQPMNMYGSNNIKYQAQNSVADKPFNNSNTTTNGNNNNNNNIMNLSTKNTTEQNFLPLKQTLTKQYENQTNFSSAANNNYFNKPMSFQNIMSEPLNQGNSSPVKQQNQINELLKENHNLKQQLIKYSKSDEKYVKLQQENRLLQDQVRELQAKVQEYEAKTLQQKRQEEQKQLRRQRQREEQEIQRQYAYMIAIEQMEQINQPAQQEPNVDNMTYEELLNLQEQIGFVSKGMKAEDINKIKEIKYDKVRMKDFCGMCSVCQTDFENSEKLKELNPCKHIYHPECINQWLQNEKNCPICKQIIQV